MYKVKFVCKEEGLIPTKGYKKDAGYDLRSAQDIILHKGQTKLISTGIYIQLPIEEDYIWEGQIRPRSGLSLKTGLRIVNSPGTIDSSYRNEIKVICFNEKEEDVIINKYDRFAQLVITRLPLIELEKVQKLDESDPRMNGFGSTGKK